MHRLIKISSAVAVLTAATACTTLPTEPNIVALPGTGKTLEQFQADDSECRQYASARTTSAGSSSTMYDAQRRYDVAFVQCMYAKGHKVPVPGAYSSAPAGVGAPPPGAPPPDVFIPPPGSAPAAPAKQ